MRSFRRLGASWLARGVALSLITSSIALGPAHPAAAATGDPFRFIYDQDGRLRAAVQGPDGSLYLTTDNSSDRIIRVTPSQ